MNTKRLTRFGLLIALACVLSFIESAVLPPMIHPAMKVGLANIVVIAALYELGAKEALVLSLVRVLLVSISFGGFGPMLYSVGGGLLSWSVMALMKRTNAFSMIGVSIAGGVCHNVGQILVAMAIFDQAMMVNLPLLMICGLVTGAVIGLAGAEVAKRLHRYLR